MCMRHIVICALRGSTMYYHFNLINSTIFGGGGVIEHNVFLFSLQLLSETFLILRRDEHIMTKMCRPIGLHVKYPFCHISKNSISTPLYEIMARAGSTLTFVPSKIFHTNFIFVKRPAIALTTHEVQFENKTTFIFYFLSFPLSFYS